jgi:hypothetical protein
MPGLIVQTELRFAASFTRRGAGLDVRLLVPLPARVGPSYIEVALLDIPQRVASGRRRDSPVCLSPPAARPVVHDQDHHEAHLIPYLFIGTSESLAHRCGSTPAFRGILASLSRSAFSSWVNGPKKARSSRAKRNGTDSYMPGLLAPNRWAAIWESRPQGGWPRSPGTVVTTTFHLFLPTYPSINVPVSRMSSLVTLPHAHRDPGPLRKDINVGLSFADLTTASYIFSPPTRSWHCLCSLPGCACLCQWPSLHNAGA